MFSQSLSGCRVQFEFPIVKLLDYEAQWADLEASRNPFVIVTMAHLKTKTTRKGLERQRSLIFRLVTRRVGIVSKDLIDRIQILPIAQLETLAENLLDFKGVDNLTAWFDQNL